MLTGLIGLTMVHRGGLRLGRLAFELNPSFRDKIGSLKVLLDLRDVDLGFPGGALGMSGKFMKEQPAAAEGRS